MQRIYCVYRAHNGQHGQQAELPESGSAINNEKPGENYTESENILKRKVQGTHSVIRFISTIPIPQNIDANDEQFWQTFWTEHNTSVQDVFALVPANEIRTLKKENPSNLATLCYKATERLARAVDSSCRTQMDHQAVLNCVRLLQRIIPYIFEDEEWRDFFWSGNDKDTSSAPLAQSLLNVICVGLHSPYWNGLYLRR